MPSLATFDCYGTLVDWEGGAAAFLYDLALRQGDAAPPPGRELRERWEEIQFEIVRGEYRPYRVVLAESLRAWMEERGYRWRDEEGEALLRSMRSWQPFPDTRPALTRARENGLRLAILSNTDRDIIEHTLRQIGVPFDAVVTAEDARAYKPSDAIFDFALEQLGTAPDDILHVAFGFKYDIGPAARHGMGTAWVNRHAEPRPGDDPYDYEWRDLWPLAELPEHPSRPK
jgi:2-haloacid dehalogenase